MAELLLTKTRIQAGVFEGILTGATAAPEIVVTHLARPVQGATLREDPEVPGQYMVRVPIPVELLSDGVQTFIVTNRETDEKLASFTIVTGQPLDEDFRSEVELMRAELDMLKRAFRRHCVETMQAQG